MNQTHIHLIITHLPIFGSILGGIVLAYGLIAKSIETKVAAYLLFIISAFGAGIAYLTGEAAEETVENIPGVIESVIKQHESAALVSLIALIILGVVALVGILTIRKTVWIKNISFVILLISIISFGLIAWTGYLGGQIRHSELNIGNANQAQGEKIKDDD